MYNIHAMKKCEARRDLPDLCQVEVNSYPGLWSERETYHQHTIYIWIMLQILLDVPILVIRRDEAGCADDPEIERDPV